MRLATARDLPPEVRMSAVIVLMESIPSRAMVTFLAHVMKTEPNLQVAHFVMTLMGGLSLTSLPDRRVL